MTKKRFTKRPSDLNSPHETLAQDRSYLRRLEKMRRDLIANVSHELRTPLTVIHGYLETLIDQSVDQTPLQTILKQIYQQSLRMESLVEDLLLLSRLETNLPESETYQEVCVHTLITTIIQDAKILSDKKNQSIQFISDESLGLYGIEKELRSAFSNIIFNHTISIWKI